MNVTALALATLETIVKQVRVFIVCLKKSSNNATSPLNLLQKESIKPPSTKFSEIALITNVTSGKLSNKKFSVPKIHKKHLKSVTQI
jgi:hypothetical protein